MFKWFKRRYFYSVSYLFKTNNGFGWGRLDFESFCKIDTFKRYSDMVNDIEKHIKKNGYNAEGVIVLNITQLRGN